MDFHHTNTRRCAYLIFNSLFDGNVVFVWDSQIAGENERRIKCRLYDINLNEILH